MQEALTFASHMENRIILLRIIHVIHCYFCCKASRLLLGSPLLVEEFYLFPHSHLIILVLAI